MCIIIFDGDNTLWDTNAVFTEAQLAILEELRRFGVNIVPKDEFDKLRLIDDMLIKKYQKHEYNFRVLCFALYLHYKNKLSEEEAMQMAYDIFEKNMKYEGLDIADKCYDVFNKKLKQIPSLFDNVKKTLKYLKAVKCVLILSSEGKKYRIMKILDEYDLKQFFVHISTEEKSIETFKKIISKISKYQETCSKKVFVVGDILEREIFMGNKIGAITIYKPSYYKPNQKPKNKMEIPNYKIKEIGDIKNIVKSLL